MTTTFMVVFLLATGCAAFGVRRQSEAATALWICNLDHTIQGGVALRLPPHSKTDQALPHFAPIESAFDPTTNRTTVRLAPVRISGENDRYYSLHFAAAYNYPGRIAQKPEAIDFELRSVVKARKLKIDLYVVFVVDRETVFLSSNRSGTKYPVQGRRWISERLVFRMPYETLIKITKAKNFAIKMDAVAFEMGEAQMDALRNFVKHMEILAVESEI